MAAHVLHVQAILTQVANANLQGMEGPCASSNGWTCHVMRTVKTIESAVVSEQVFSQLECQNVGEVAVLGACASQGWEAG